MERGWHDNCRFAKDIDHMPTTDCLTTRSPTGEKNMVDEISRDRDKDTGAIGIFRVRERRPARREPLLSREGLLDAKLVWVDFEEHRSFVSEPHAPQ